MPALTQDRLKEVLHYDPETGEWRWRVDRTCGRYNHIVTAHAGDVAGTINKDGYRVIKIDGKQYYAHRLAVLHQTGDWPTDKVDHRDTDESNNEWKNLREATHAQNNANTGVSKNNKLGIKGVSRLPSGKYRAGIKVDGRQIHLGTRDTAEEAAELYAKAANRHFGDFARTA